MSKHDLIPCKIIFKDPVSLIEDCCICWINRYEIDNYNKNENNFIMPFGDLNPPINKDTIAEIVIYGEIETFPCSNGKIIRNRQIVQRHGASISF